MFRRVKADIIEKLNIGYEEKYEEDSDSSGKSNNLYKKKLKITEGKKKMMGVV